MIDILHRTARYIALNKPAGVTVIPARNEPPELALRQRAEAALGLPLWVVHRLDRDTSGVVLFALDAETHRALNSLFEHGQIAKTYLAWVCGVPEPRQGRIDAPLISARKGKMRPALPGERDAKAAATRYAVEAVGEQDGQPISRLRCWPETGRQHQIRVHLRSIGHPILGDALYGKTVQSWAPRCLLHALEVRVPALLGVAETMIAAPVPADFRDSNSRSDR